MSAVIGDNMPRIDVLQNCFQVEDIRSQSKGIDFKGFLRIFADLKNPDRMEREAAEEDKRKRIFLNIARTSLLVMFIFLPTSSSTIFQAFGTETFDDGTTRNAGKMTKMLTGQGFKKGVGESFVTISFFDLSSNVRYSATLGWYQGLMGDNISIKRRRAKHIENVLIKRSYVAGHPSLY